MKTTLGRSAVAVLMVTIIGISLAATSWHVAEQQTLTAGETSDRGATSEREGPRTTQASARPQQQAQARVASFTQKARFADGVSVQVTKIRRTELLKPLTAHGVDKGDPVQVLSLRITNGSRKVVALTGARPVIRYGTRQKLSKRVHDRSWLPMTGNILPGQSRATEFGFAVPSKHYSSAVLSFAFSPAHAPARFTGSIDYSPVTGTLFNDPTGPKSEQLAIIRQVERSINATAPGETIRIAHYSFDVKSSAQALLRAHRRGVHVQMIVDQHENLVTSETQSLIDELGENHTSTSFVARCKASCMSNRTSAMHAKFFLFSSVGSSPKVSMITSSNLTHTNSKNSWNDLQTVVGDTVVFDSLNRYFTDMLPDKNRPNYFRTTTSGPYKLYFYPRAEGRGGGRPTVLNALNGVTCSGAAPGYGTKDGRTIVRVTMYSWTGSRMDIARKLVDLHDAGCEVQVIYNSGRSSYAITSTLLQRSAAHGGLALYNAWFDDNYNALPELYMHQKALAISGVVNGRTNTKIVYAGSQNYTSNATLDNNEIVLRTTDDATYDAYAENFKVMRSHARRLSR